jgi:small subunit ribosomal protein S17
MTKETQKTRKGIIISDKMDKTVTVKIDRVVAHRIYKKKFVLSKNFKAHDETNEFKTGDVVEIVETAPISKDKKFKVLRKVK